MWKSCCRSWLVDALLLLCLSVELIVGEYNCNHSYVLNSNGAFHQNVYNSNEYCKDSCLQSSSPLEVSANPDCVLLHRILPDYNSVIDDGDCLELQFMPGEYWFSSLSQIQLSYSLVLTAPWGLVSIACSQTSQNTCNTGEEGESSPGANINGNFMMAVNGSQDRDVFVSIDSLDFSNCSKRIQFNFLTNVSVTNSSFIGFSSSALDLFNVDYAIIQNTTFKNCTSRDVNAQFRGNGAGLSAAYYYTNASRGHVFPRLEVIGCWFENNYAHSLSSDHISQALVNSVISGRGGGIVLLPQDLSNAHFLIKDSVFVDNWAQEYGGGIWTRVSGSNTYHDFVLEGCVFRRNYGGENGYGGGIQMALLLRNVDSSRPIRIVLTGCHFEDNVADFGGGLSVTEVYGQGRGNEVSVSDTQFVRNRASAAGAAVMFQTFSYVQNRLQRFYYNFTNCVFRENEAVGGTFGAGFNSVNFFGNILFSGNVGPALRLVGALLEVHGNLSFVGNTVPYNVEGGALFIQAFGQVKMYSNTSLQFSNNIANRTGAAIVVDVQRSSPVFSELIYNPQCFLIYEDPTAQPVQWDNVSISFSGNQASVGPAVFISHLKHCAWFSSDPVGDGTINKIVTVFSATLFPNWTAFNFDATNIALSHRDNPYDHRFYIQTEPFLISSSVEKQKHVTIRPGQTVPVNLTALDQFGNPTYLIARVVDSRSTITVGAFSQAGRRNENLTSESSLIVFDPSLLPVDPAVGMADLMYGYSERDDVTGLQDDLTIPVSIDTPFNVLGTETIYFNMTLSQCQPGYELAEVNGIYTCDCSRRSQYILTCNENVIVLKDGTWAGRELEQGFPHLDITLCPASYCSCQSLSAEVCANLYHQDNNAPNEQCHATRQGTLCGECVNGTAVGVLRTNCRQCKDNKYYTIALLVIADMVVLGFVFFTFMKLDFHFPYSLKGLLFYIQTAYYVTESFPASFWDVRKYMLYISSALSLYFPYDFCLSPGTDALTTFGLKFIPPAIAFIMCLAVAIGVYADRSRIGRAGRRHVWRVLWFLLLLFYAPLLHTCTALLKCPVTPSASGREEARRWYFNGEVECFHDPVHIVLSIVAILVLTALVLLIPAMAIFISITSHMKFRYRTVEWIVAALGEGYRDCLEARLYAVWELMRRLLLVSIVVAAPGRSVASAYVVIASFGVHVFFNPYQKLFQNILETLVLLNYVVFLLLRSNETVLGAVNSGYYSGNLIPTTLGDSLPPVDNVAWLFIPLFYLPLLVAVVFSIGALVYRITKSTRQWRQKKDDKPAVTNVELSGYYMNVERTDTQVSRTTVAIDDASVSLNNS